MTTPVIEQPQLTQWADRNQEGLLNAFFVMYKTARLVDANNQTFKKQLESFFFSFRTVIDQTDQITIKTVSDRYFINDRVVALDDRRLEGIALVLSEWRQLGIGGVSLNDGITEDEISRFFAFVADMSPNNENLETLGEQFKTNDLPHVQLLSVEEVTPDKPELDENERQRFRVMARKQFFQAMAVVEDVTAQTGEDREINSAKTKRVVHSLIDHIARDESSLLELAAIKSFDDYTYAHCTNVCVYALTLGVRLGLDRPRLSQLGFAALFHDIGKVKLPSDLISKPDAYDEDDWLQMQRHPQLGAKTVLRNLKFDEHTARAARVAFEHHIHTDFTGYPVLHYRQRATTLFSRIISVVDTFDALSSGRVYLRKAIPPDEVFRKMRYQMEIKFDPLLLKIFNDIVGVYPAGSLVLLNTDELALVLTNSDTDKTRPYVKILGNREGLFEQAEWADLSSPEQLHRSVVRMVDPSRYGLDNRDFILQD